jgi:hypothetical protein
MLQNKLDEKRARRGALPSPQAQLQLFGAIL